MNKNQVTYFFISGLQRGDLQDKWLECWNGFAVIFLARNLPVFYIEVGVRIQTTKKEFFEPGTYLK